MAIDGFKEKQYKGNHQKEYRQQVVAFSLVRSQIEGYKKEQRESYTVKYIYLADIHIGHIRKKVENICPKQVSDDYQGNSPSYSLLYAYMVPTHLLWILLPDEQVGEDKA